LIHRKFKKELVKSI